MQCAAQLITDRDSTARQGEYKAAGIVSIGAQLGRQKPACIFPITKDHRSLATIACTPDLGRLFF